MLALVVAVLMASLVRYMHGSYAHYDVLLYQHYAIDFWAGRTLPAEYPPLAVLSFSLTVLPPLPDVVTVFALWMLGLLVVCLVAIARRESPRAAEVCAVYLAAGTWPTVLGRYDLVPAAVTLAAWWAVRQRHFTAAYGLLAAGALLKLYPAVLVPAVVIEHYRALERSPLRSRPPRAVLAGAALFCGAVGAGFAVALLLDPGGWLGPFTYSAHRPLQVESLPATLLWATSAFGLPVTHEVSFHSDNLLGRLDGVIGAGAQVAMAAGLVWVYWSQAAGRLGFASAFAVCLLIVICTGRVLSPQYLIWVLPLIAVAERDYDPLWLAVCVLTTLVFPFAYSQVHPPGSGPPAGLPLLLLGLIAVRNGTLVVATIRFIRRSLTGQGGPGPAPGTPLA